MGSFNLNSKSTSLKFSHRTLKLISKMKTITVIFVNLIIWSLFLNGEGRLLTTQQKAAIEEPESESPFGVDVEEEAESETFRYERIPDPEAEPETLRYERNAEPEAEPEMFRYERNAEPEAEPEMSRTERSAEPYAEPEPFRSERSAEPEAEPEMFRAERSAEPLAEPETF